MSEELKDAAKQDAAQIVSGIEDKDKMVTEIKEVLDLPGESVLDRG